MTYVLGLVLRDKVARSGEENKSPITFLMDDSRKLPSVIGPFRARLLRKALDTPKGHILYSYLHRTDVSEEIRTA